MRRNSPKRPWAVALLVLGSAVPAVAQETPTPPTAPPPQAVAPMSLKPLPERPIPDDPPPHEGALYDFPLTIQPPDILVVESLEALPGRPITGEHLVRPDGTISLGFYGDVHVRGLTVAQAKVKIILHLRRYLSDEMLGLVLITGQDAPDGPDAEPGPIVPGPESKPGDGQDVPKASDLKPAPNAASSFLSNRPVRRSNRRVGQLVGQVAAPTPPVGTQSLLGRTDPPVSALREKPLKLLETNSGLHFEAVNPADSDRVFVEITAFNSLVYFVLGDVGTPGALPYTGRETVLVALNYAGGFTPTAEPVNFHLYRPARGGTPARDYRIDHKAILRGDARANLQVFPGDRLVAERSPAVARTMQLDRSLASFHALFGAASQAAVAARAIGEIKGIGDAEREALLRPYLDLLKEIPHALTEDPAAPPGDR